MLDYFPVARLLRSSLWVSSSLIQAKHEVTRLFSCFSRALLSFSKARVQLLLSYSLSLRPLYQRWAWGGGWERGGEDYCSTFYSFRVALSAFVVKISFCTSVSAFLLASNFTESSMIFFSCLEFTSARFLLSVRRLCTSLSEDWCSPILNLFDRSLWAESSSIMSFCVWMRSVCRSSCSFDSWSSSRFIYAFFSSWVSRNFLSR